MPTSKFTRSRSKRGPSTPLWDNEALRRSLFAAQAVIEITRRAVASELLEDLDDTVIVDALAVASRLVDDVASALESGK